MVFLWKWNFKLSKFKEEAFSFTALQTYFVNCNNNNADFHMHIICRIFLSSGYMN